jgi:hypothetical protein
MTDDLITHTMEYYSSIKKNEIMLFTEKWMEMGDQPSSERWGNLDQKQNNNNRDNNDRA